MLAINTMLNIATSERLVILDPKWDKKDNLRYCVKRTFVTYTGYFILLK